MTFLALNYKIPANPSRYRVAVWKALRELGAVYLQDGVAAVPQQDGMEQALRELREELGVTLPADALQECGVRHFTFEDVFHGRLFKDNQVSKVFCLWLDKDAEDFTVQKEEIDYVRWFGLEEAIEAVKNNTIPNCIYLEELEMVAAATR
mgnify:CR=1 FL=1